MGRGPKIIVLFQVITSKWSISQWLDSLAEQLQLLFKFQHGSNESELYTISIWSFSSYNSLPWLPNLNHSKFIVQLFWMNTFKHVVKQGFFYRSALIPKRTPTWRTCIRGPPLTGFPGLRCQMGCFGQRCGPREAQEFVPRVRGSQDSGWKLKGF